MEMESMEMETDDMSNAEDDPKYAYEINERVMCFHGPLIYEGKVLKVKTENNNDNFYWVHYSGWNKSWDEWVPEKRVLKYNVESLEKQRLLKASHEASRKSEKKVALGKSITPIPIVKKKVVVVTPKVGFASNLNSSSSTQVADMKPVIKPKKQSLVSKELEAAEREQRIRKRGETTEDNQYALKQEVKIAMPEKLKCFLADDWDNVIRQKRLVTLPARNTVQIILDNYITSREPDDTVVELSNGLLSYFNAMLGPKLLYKYERIQYGNTLEEHKKISTDNEEFMPATWYGVSHLLRLIYSLGSVLAYSTMEEEGVHNLAHLVEDLLKFLVDRYDIYFSPEDYKMSSPEYQRRSNLL